MQKFDNKINNKISLSLFPLQHEQNRSSLNHGAVKIDPQRPIVNYFALISRRNMHPARAGGTLANSSPPPPNPSLKSTKQQKSSRSPCVPNFETSTHVRTRRKVLSSRLLKHTHTRIHARTRTHDRSKSPGLTRKGADDVTKRLPFRRDESIQCRFPRIEAS